MRLKELRIKNNFSQSDFAEKIGISRQAYIKYESEKGMPPLETLLAISKICNVSIDYIIGKEDKETYDNIDIRVLINMIENNKIFNLGNPLSDEDMQYIKHTLEYVLKKIR